jgi:type IV pilus assembly protein PilM
MLKLVQNWFAPRVNPIGVDFGSDCLRMAQVQHTGKEYNLVAAASADVPSHVRYNAAARLAFFVETVRDLLSQGQFRSRQAVLGLPAASMHIQHLRMAKMDDAETRKALVWEAQGKMPIEPAHALMRHVIAGEIYQDQEPKNEVIVMAAQRELVHQFLAAAARARLDVVGMNVEAKAVVDCFAHTYRRKADGESTTCYLDIGCCASRAYIARGNAIFFARTIPIGGEHFSKAVAQALKINLDEAKLLRVKLCAAQPALNERNEKQTVRAPEPSIDNSFAVLGAALQAKAPAATPGAGAATATPQAAATAAMAPPTPVAPTDPLAAQARQVEQACREPIARLIEELDLCRRYYEATFQNRPVDRLIFVGGESRHKWLCQQVARELGLAAQLGDPLVRMSKVSDVGIESGIDRRQPQPAWAVAIGLSLGPTNGAGGAEPVAVGLGAGAGTGASAAGAANAGAGELSRGGE